MLLLRGNFAMASSYNTYYFLKSICYYHSWKFFHFHLMYGYTWNPKKYIQMTVVIIEIKIAVMCDSQVDYSDTSDIHDDT